MREKCNKKDKGITLIALVVTIIVLLILAEISIGMLLGNNGILGQADKAKLEIGHARLVEEIQLKQTEYVGKYYLGNRGQTLIEFLNNEGILESETLPAKINVERLIPNGEIITGKGTGENDVYKLEKSPDKENEYILKYYENIQYWKELVRLPDFAVHSSNAAEQFGYELRCVQGTGYIELYKDGEFMKITEEMHPVVFSLTSKAYNVWVSSEGRINAEDIIYYKYGELTGYGSFKGDNVTVIFLVTVEEDVDVSVTISIERVDSQNAWPHGWDFGNENVHVTPGSEVEKPEILNPSPEPGSESGSG